MRISVEADDPGHTALIRRVPADGVLLDGEVVREVITADDVEGFVKVYARDPQGRCIHDGAEWRTETRRGRVVIHVRSER